MYVYVHRSVYIYFLVTTKQKSILDTQKKRNESKHNTKDSHPITREESKRRRKEQQRTTKQPQNN